MGRRYDDRRWIQNPDGSFSRRESVGRELLPAVVVPEPNYVKDISTTSAAAQLAEELGVDLSTVTGTGKNGKITKADVEAAAA